MTTSLRVPLLGDSHDTPDAAGSPRRVVELRSAAGDRLLVELFEEPEPWLRRILEQVEELLGLRPGWNSYAAAPVSLAAAAALIELVGDTMSATTPSPHISPLSSGGVQMEWHERDMTIEVVIDRIGQGSVWYEDSRTGVAGELPLDRPYDRLRGVLVELEGRA